MRVARLFFAALFVAALGFAACGSRTGLLSGGGAGAAGGAGAVPPSSGWDVSVFRQRAVTKVDLLLTLDNSISMADKQALAQKSEQRFFWRHVVTSIAS